MKKRSLLVLAISVLCILAVTTPALASSHREAPLISQDPVADNTDVYMFRSPDATNSVTMLANYVPMEEPAGGPNFYRFGDNVRYRFTVYNNRDKNADIFFDFVFKTRIQNGSTFLYNTGPITSLTSPTFNLRQTYTVTMTRRGHRAVVLGKNLPTPPCNVGPKSTPGYSALAASAIRSLPGGIKVFAGQRDDPFFADVGGLFDLLTIRNPPGNAGGGVDGLGGFNCQTIALQVPISMLTANRTMPTNTLDPKAVIGMYSSAMRNQQSVLRSRLHGRRSKSDDRIKYTLRNRMVQVSRLGEPLINEVVIPLGKKDMWNASNPVRDSQFLKYYLNPELAGLITALYGIPVPPNPRTDLQAILLNGFTLGSFSTLGGPPNADLVRLNVAIPAVSPTDAGYSRLGLLGGDAGGFPNGRRPSDDVVDIELQAIAGATPFTPTFNVAPNNQLGDGVNTNDAAFLTSFPYAADPWSGFNSPHNP